MDVAPGAGRYAGAAAVLGLLAFPLSPVATAAGVAVAAFVLWFHRDPDREAPASGVVSPADGRVSVIREEGDRIRVGVFMNLHDVHVNRAPLGGTVEAVEHTPGAHRPAFSKDSERNERVRIEWGDHAVVLIAGAFARRITPYVDPGETVDRGERIGHVSFGSRADVLLPARVGREDVVVAEGDRVRAGESVIARVDRRT
jgi:phosphatidylserine decarboxylase